MDVGWHMLRVTGKCISPFYEVLLPAVHGPIRKNSDPLFQQKKLIFQKKKSFFFIFAVSSPPSLVDIHAHPPTHHWLSYTLPCVSTRNRSKRRYNVVEFS